MTSLFGLACHYTFRSTPIDLAPQGNEAQAAFVPTPQPGPDAHNVVLNFSLMVARTVTKSSSAQRHPPTLRSGRFSRGVGSRSLPRSNSQSFIVIKSKSCHVSCCNQALTPDRDGSGLEVITLSRSFISSISKAKTATLSERPSVLDPPYLINVYHVVCMLLNRFNSISNSRQTQIDVLTDNIERSKRIFLEKKTLEIHLISL
jgi:hypothetical protein